MYNPKIIVQYNKTADQWQAWIEESPCDKGDADFAMDAVYRLLEDLEPEACDLTLHIDQDQDGSDVVIREACWQPPELLFRCERCNGRGEYVGLTVVEPCKSCHGRGWMVA